MGLGENTKWGNGGSSTGYKQFFLVISEITSLNRCLVERQGGGLGGGRMWKFSSGSVLFSWVKKSTAADGSEEGEGVSEGRKKRKGLKHFPSHQKMSYLKNLKFYHVPLLLKSFTTF